MAVASALPEVCFTTAPSSTPLMQLSLTRGHLLVVGVDQKEPGCKQLSAAPTAFSPAPGVIASISDSLSGVKCRLPSGITESAISPCDSEWALPFRRRKGLRIRVAHAQRLNQPIRNPEKNTERQPLQQQIAIVCLGYLLGSMAIPERSSRNLCLGCRTQSQ